MPTSVVPFGAAFLILARIFGTSVVIWLLPVPAQATGLGSVAQLSTSLAPMSIVTSGTSPLAWWALRNFTAAASCEPPAG